MAKPSIKRPMTADEIEAAKLLQQVTFPIASWDKKFAASVQAVVTPPPAPTCNCEPHYVTHELHGLQLDPPKYLHASTCPMSAPPWVPMIGEKMVPQLWRLVSRYRRQIRHPERLKYLRMAELLQAPDFRKREAAMKLLAKRQKERDRYHAAMKANTQTTPTP